MLSNKDINNLILSELDLKDVFNCRLVSSEWKNFIETHYTKTLFKKVFGVEGDNFNQLVHRFIYRGVVKDLKKNISEINYCLMVPSGKWSYIRCKCGRWFLGKDMANLVSQIVYDCCLNCEHLRCYSTFKPLLNRP